MRKSVEIGCVANWFRTMAMSVGISETPKQHLWCQRAHCVLILLFYSQRVLMIKMCFMWLPPCGTVWPEKIPQSLNCFHKNCPPSRGVHTQEKSTYYSQKRKAEVVDWTCCLFSHPSFMTWKYQQRYASISHSGRDSIAPCVAEGHSLDLENEDLLKLVNKPSVSSSRAFMSKK